jgi:hypothetical protein
MQFSKIAKATLGACLFAGLAGCSGAPSDDDVKRAIGNLTGNCRYLTIAHVLKVNWAVPGSADYQVDLQYAIRAAPLPEARAVTAGITAPLAELNVRVAAASFQRDKDFNTNAAYLDRIERAQKAGDDAAAVSYERQRSDFNAKELEPSLKLARQLAEEKKNLIKQGARPLREAFFKACPDTPASMYDRIYDNTDVEQYVETRTVDLATSMRMSNDGKRWEMQK